MTYKETAYLIENSSWYKEITERNSAAAKLADLTKSQFERELGIVIDRHRRQQVHIDTIKRSCHINA